MSNKDQKCRLIPYKITPVVSIQEVTGQNFGWNITKFGIPKLWTETTGEGTIAALIDTSISLGHFDLDSNIIDGKNYVEPGTSCDSSIDGSTHSSHCAGIICAKNNDIGICGIAPAAKILAIKCLGKNGTGSFLNVAKAVRWAADQGVDVISMSLGSPNPMQEMRKAIQYAYSKNIPVVAAAGNSGNKRQIFYPASYPECISVGAIDENMTLAKFSNFSKNLDFLAPGVSITSTTLAPNEYGVYSGSSQAAPFLTGIILLLKAYVKKNNTNIDISSVDKLKLLLKKYCRKIDDKNYQSAGFFDASSFEDFLKDNPQEVIQQVINSQLASVSTTQPAS